MIFHFHKTKVSVNLFIVLKISLASHVTLLVIVIITCIHERKSPFARAAGTVFRIASISKVFTSTAAMQLVEQNKLDINKDVQAYLKDFNINNKTGKKLTLDHLMAHMTGFDYVDLPSMDNSSPEKYYPLDEFVKQNAPSVVHNPGEVYRYDNYAFVLLGYIVQNITGIPFHQYVENNIFKPLGMNSSSFIMKPEIHANLAPGYRARIHWPSFYNVVTGKTLALPNLIALQHIPLSPAGVIAKRPAPIALPNSCAA